MTIRTRPYAPAADGSSTAPDEEATDSDHPSAPDGGPTRPSGSSEILALCLVAADDEDKPMEMPTCILGMDVHPLTCLIPGPTHREHRCRREDIQQHGVRHPLVRLKGMLIDGRSTGMACEDLGIVPDIIDLPDGTDAIAYLMSVNVHRRHLSKLQLAIIAVASHDLVKTGYNQYSGGGEVISPPATNEDMAALVGGSTRLIQQAKLIHQAGLDQEVLTAGMSWKEVLAKVNKILKKPELDTSDPAAEQRQDGTVDQDKASANATSKKPRRAKLPEDVVELRRIVRQHEDEIRELNACLELAQAEVESLKTKCQDLEAKIALSKPQDNLPVRETSVPWSVGGVPSGQSTDSGSRIRPKETVEQSNILPFEPMVVAEVPGE